MLYSDLIEKSKNWNLTHASEGRGFSGTLMTVLRRRPPPPNYKPSPAAKTKSSGGVWVIIGVLLSMIAVLSYYIWDNARRVNGITPSPVITVPLVQESNQPLSKLPIAQEPVVPVVKESIPAPKPTPVPEGTSTTSFEFYKLLPEMKVGNVPEPIPPAPAKATVKDVPKPASKESTKKSGSKESVAIPSAASTIYILQAGAFRTSQEADRLRARIAFMGLESTIQIVGGGTADVWHRVRLGPFRDFNQATQIQQRLRQDGISAILSKERHS